MNILIDKEHVSFTLQGEENASEVILAIRDWLKSGERIITNVGISNNLNEDDTRDWHDIPITDVKELQIESLHNFEFRFSVLRWLQNYIQTLQKALQKTDTKTIEQLKQQSDEVRDLLLFVLSPGNTNSIMDKLISSSSSSEDNVFLTQLLETFRIQEHEMSAPLQESMLTAGMIMREIESYKEIPVLVQTGKGTEAMAKLVRFSDLASRLLRVYPYLTFTYQKEFTEETKQRINEINAILHELADALQKMDMVHAGDILEYELIPALEKWIQVFYDEYKAFSC